MARRSSESEFSPRRRKRWPRGFYWVTGGGLAIVSALVGRVSGEKYPDERIYIWLVASVGIFVGLAILSLGSRYRQEEAARRERKADKRQSSDTPPIEGDGTPPQRDRDGAKAGDGSGH